MNDVILRYKSAYIEKIVEDLKIEYENHTDKTELYKKIMLINNLRIKINGKLNRIL